MEDNTVNSGSDWNMEKCIIIEITYILIVTDRQTQVNRQTSSNKQTDKLKWTGRQTSDCLDISFFLIIHFLQYGTLVTKNCSGFQNCL